jgi:hypothetical protein
LGVVAKRILTGLARIALCCALVDGQQHPLPAQVQPYPAAWAVEDAPNPKSLNGYAWFPLTTKVPAFAEPERRLEVAHRAAKLFSENGYIQNNGPTEVSVKR